MNLSLLCLMLYLEDDLNRIKYSKIRIDGSESGIPYLEMDIAPLGNLYYRFF